MKHIISFMIFIILFELFLLLGTSVLLTLKSYKPIKEILNLLDSDLTLRMEHSQAVNEFRYISDCIAVSQERNEYMSEELLQKIALLKESQNIALITQINPHFLYNTLDNIKWKVMEQCGGSSSGVEMIEDLAQLLRISLETKENLVTLEKELEHVGVYIRILEARYENKFDVTYVIQEELLKYRVPKIVLQPLVENAVYHGIKKSPGRGHITISVQKSGPDIRISIRDNGVGIGAEELEQIRERLRQDTIREDTNIAMVNVNSRLKLAFEKQYGLRIESREGIGTEVILTIPPVI